jgi:sterol desaturase/sphingolipid hydroxylase (fatty acid hydroxylase superfamily)
MNLSPFTLITVMGVFILLFAAEKLFPLRQSRGPLLTRLFINAAISGLAFAVAAMVVRPSALRALNWASEQSFGLIHLLPWPWAQFITGFLLLDLSFYYWHVLNHKSPLLWRFHNVHHIDCDLDVSTGFRFHFGEVLLSTLFRVVQVSLTGISFATFAIYEVVFQTNTLFHHSNLRLPIRLERWLNKILVTPRMHGIHHSQVQRETNSNFGVVLRWWDRLHNTLVLNILQSRITIGIPGYASSDDNSLWRTFTMPFIKQRDYWRKSDGSTPSRDTADFERNPCQLAE